MKLEANDVRVQPAPEPGKAPTASVHMMGFDGKTATAKMSAMRLMVLGSQCYSVAKKMMEAG